MTVWKRLVDGGTRESMEILWRALESLIAGIGTHAIGYNNTDQLQFQSEVHEQLRKISKHPDESVTAVVETINRVTRDYHMLTLERVHSRTSQLRSVISIFSKHVVDSSACGREHIEQLASAEKQLETATDLITYLRIKKSLGENLRKIRETQLAQQDRASRVLCETAAEVAPPPAAALRTPPEPPDPRTGFASRKGAEARFAYNRAHGVATYVAVFVCHNYDGICNRHGVDAGDQLYAHLAKFVAVRMPSDTKYFSWNANSFVALLTGIRNIDHARREIPHIVAARLESVVAAGSGSQTMPLRAEVTAILDEPTNPVNDWIAQLDAFVATHRS